MKTRELLVVSFVFIGGLLVWPLLTVPNRPVLVAGVPALVLYLFGVWVAIIAVLAWASHRTRGDDTP